MSTITYKKESVWQLQKAKAQFSEVVNHALSGEPQLITRSGRPSVYIVSAESYRAENDKTGLNRKDILMACPCNDIVLDVVRDKSEGREVVI